MNTKELLKKVRQIEISIRGVVNEVFAGEYHSVFKGRGMEFAEVREYQVGDDVRNIDWNVTSRMNHPYVKVFDEERELTVMILFDSSSSEAFGTRGSTKGQVAIEIAALLASSAIKNNDKVGLIIFSDGVDKFVPPRKGRQHVLRVIRELLYIGSLHESERSAQTNLAEALKFLNQILKRRATVFLISDFMTEGFDKDLQIANKRHDLVAIHLIDPLEEALPSVGLIELEDLETGEVLLLDTSDREVRDTVATTADSDKLKLERYFKSIGMDYIDIYTHQSYVKPLTRFFRMRAKRFH
ncbi:MAG: DUF58 domain-containing protein [Calditrichaeota bacterium]|nr:MAG: DUF58 domain-containing protein [Calditrichota bacterium]